MKCFNILLTRGLLLVSYLIMNSRFLCSGISADGVIPLPREISVIVLLANIFLLDKLARLQVALSQHYHELPHDMHELPPPIILAAA